MFYYVAKVCWALVEPSNSLLFLLILASICRLAGRRRTATALVGIVVVAGVAITVLPIDNLLVTPLENRFPRPPEPACIDGILVLGGGQSRILSVSWGMATSEAHLQRQIEAAKLLRDHPEAHLVFAGGAAMVTPLPPTEADIAREIFEDLGADMSRITFESASRDTYENLVNAQALVHPRPGQTWVLVTSAVHMPRAIAIARHIGWQMIPWPTDYDTTRRIWPPLHFKFAENLQRVTMGLREWIGLVAYRLADRTDTLLPAPEPVLSATTCDAVSHQGKSDRS